MTFRTALIQLAHKEASLRGLLVPLLRVGGRYVPWKVGAIVPLRKGPHDPNNTQVEVLGYTRKWTEYGPEPFVDFYQTRDVETGEEHLLHPKVLHSQIKWDIRMPMDDAFTAVTRALKSLGVLDELQRRAGTVRGTLGFDVKYGKKVEFQKVVSGLKARLSSNGTKPATDGVRISLQVPTGDTETTDFWVTVEHRYDDAEVLHRIEVGRL